MMILSILFYLSVVVLACYLGDKYAKHLQKKIFKKTLLTLVRNFMPTMIAHDLVGVQPMDKPAGQIFSMRYIYGAPQQLEFDFTVKEPVQLEFDFDECITYKVKRLPIRNTFYCPGDKEPVKEFPIRYIPRGEDAELALKYNVQSDPDGGIIAALKRVTKDLPTN